MTCVPLCKSHSFPSLSARLRWKQVPLSLWVTSSQWDRERELGKRDWKHSKNGGRLYLQVEVICLLKWASWGLALGSNRSAPGEQGSSIWTVPTGSHQLPEKIRPALLGLKASFNLLMRQIGKQKNLLKSHSGKFFGLFQIKPECGTDHVQER